MKPIAWMLNGIVHEFDPSDWSKEKYPDQAVIPLYTHPVKELTDEEIQEIAHGFGAIGWMGDTTYEFARAILRKAQEK